MRTPTWVYREMEDYYASVLRNCTGMSESKKIHARIVVSSLSHSNFLATKMVHIFSANGEIDHARQVFDQVPEPNTFLYNAMIRAYTHHCRYGEAIVLYKEMLRIPIAADRFTYPFILKACAGLLLLVLGKQIHSQICKCGLASASVVENSILEMYAKSEESSDAHRIFDEIREKDAVSWNTLISMHARLGQMRRARVLFDSMPEKTVISWTVLISGYTMIGRYADALEVFHQMQMAGVKPDDISVVSVLPACSQLGALELGKWIHIYADKTGLLRNTFICNALMEMYAKCGSIDQARQLFNGMVERDVISWSTVIGGLANHGRAREAIELFEEMESDGRVKPNSITFLGLLSACAHAGFLEQGLQFFDTMTMFYGLTPGVEHYGCMVDLLGRSGCIDRAVGLINSMPVPPDAAIWGSLLSACKTHGNIENAIIAMEHLLELEPEDTGNYVLLSNTYAAAERWDGVSKMRKMIRSRNMKKMPGCSLIEVNNVVKEFAAGNDLDPQFGEISGMLELLTLQASETDAVIMDSR